MNLEDYMSSDLEVVHMPFTAMAEVTISIDYDSATPLGFEYSHCACLHCAFLSAIKSAPHQMSLRHFKCNYLGSYLVSIGNTPVFSIADVDQELACLKQLPSPPDSVSLVLAPEHKTDFSEHPAPSGIWF